MGVSLENRTLYSWHQYLNAIKYLYLNPLETEFLWCVTTRRMHYVNPEPVHIGDTDISPSASVHNLGVVMNGDFSVITHVKMQVRSCYHFVCQIRLIWRSLTKKATKMLVSSFICSRIDYCNPLFSVLPRSTTSPLGSLLHAVGRNVSGR